MTPLTSLKTSLQVLIHYTKMDVNLQYRKYLAYCDVIKLPEAQRVTVANFFDEKILSFVAHANMNCVEKIVWAFSKYIRKSVQDDLLYYSEACYVHFVDVKLYFLLANPLRRFSNRSLAMTYFTVPTPRILVGVGF